MAEEKKAAPKPAEPKKEIKLVEKPTDSGKEKKTGTQNWMLVGGLVVVIIIIYLVYQLGILRFSS